MSLVFRHSTDRSSHAESAPSRCGSAAGPLRSGLHGQPRADPRVRAAAHDQAGGRRRCPRRDIPDRLAAAGRGAGRRRRAAVALRRGPAGPRQLLPGRAAPVRAGRPTPRRSGPRVPSARAHLADALRRLSEQDRELLTLATWEGLDYGQIAAVLGCSRNAVRIRLHRARARLAAQLASHDTAEPTSTREGDPASLGNPGGLADRGEPGALAGPGDFRRFTGTGRPRGLTAFAPVGARTSVQPDQNQRG
jgi:predicted DNA-binding protein (UPF0251 family)